MIFRSFNIYVSSAANLVYWERVLWGKLRIWLCKCSYHGNDTPADPNMVVFVLPPQVTYLHTKNEGGLKIFISNFASLSWRIALNYSNNFAPNIKVVTRTGDREIRSVSTRLLDNLGDCSPSVREQAPDEREKNKIGRAKWTWRGGIFPSPDNSRLSLRAVSSFRYNTIGGLFTG